MRYKRYKVFFKYTSITVRAFNEKEAGILAQAEAIKKGNDYTIIRILEVCE